MRGRVIFGVLTTSVGLALAPATASAARPECSVERLAPKKKSYNSNAQADPLGTAITDASAGATLRVIGTCRGNFVIDKSLTLRGRDAETQIDSLDGNGGGRVLTVLSGPSGGDPVRVEVSRLAIGNGETGIVTHDRSALTIDDSAVRDNTGAGISAPCPGCASGQLTLNHSNISENGAGIAATPPRVLTLNSSTVSHNEGAGIFTTGLSMVNGAVMVLNSSTVQSNGGSGITFGRIGSLTLTDSSVSDNGATGIATTGSPITGANATISGNMGGGISTSFGRLTLTDSMVSGNVTTGNGGGIAGPFITGQQGAVLTRTTVRGNHADGGGGGIYSVQASLVDSTVTQNSAGGSGGGLYVANFVGGMTTFGTLSLAGTTVTGNTAGLSGGGIFAEPGATQTLDAASSVCGNTPDDAPQCLPPL